MSKDMKKMMVPALRFPEFRDSGEWTTKELGKVAALITEKAGSMRYTLMSVTAGIGLVTQIEKFGKEIAGEAYKNYYVIRKGDFAYNKSSTKQHPEGQMALLEGVEQGAVPNSIFTCFRLDQECVSPYFLKYPFATNIHGKWLRNYIAVGARANGALNVDSKYLLAMPITFPTLKEQQKIASCLSSIDDLITAQSQKIDTLKTHKKSLMQKLFPRDGETVPRLRFPEFRNAGSWKKITLGEIGEVITGNTPSTTVKEYYGGNRLFVSPADMADHRYIYRTKTTLTELGYSKTRVIPAGSVLFVCIGSTIGKIGQNKVDCATNQQINSIVPSQNYSGGFVYYSLDLNASSISELAGRQAVPIINKTMFSSVVLSAPSFNEQLQIAECLSSLDVIIGLQSEKLDSLKIHKKSLLQQLFPTDTGEIL